MKRIAIAAVAAVVVAGGAGAAWAIAENDERITDDQRDRVNQAALERVGGGQVIEAEADDEDGARRYEVEVSKDGQIWEVLLDENFAVLGASTDNDQRDARENEADHAPISAEELARVSAAAAPAVAGGRVIDVDRSDDAGEAWDVEVVDEQGQNWDVTLDAELKVLSVVRD
jgi:uncharacterized membrane protein YkoI